MIKHIVMWRLKDEKKIENAKRIKESLEALNGVIEELKFIEVGININQGEQVYDVVLNSDFDNIDDLNNYQKHPEHIKVGGFIKEVTESRVVVDYEF
ncbi:Dabb family protein [Clostridium paraputrificum]|uniref:Dabb family protein n=1 Tax=Clostridium paraputrificum TaxID=29363 RepID=UPI003D351D53